MGKVVFGLLAIAILGVLALYAFDPSYQQQRSDAAFYAAESQRIALEQQASKATAQATELEQQQQIRAASVPTQTVVSAIMPFIEIALGGLIIGLVTAWAIDYYKQRRMPLIRADQNGILPLDRAALQTGIYDREITASLLGFHQAQITRAQHQPGQTPHSINYSPSWTRTELPQALIDQGAEVLSLEDALNSSVMSFSQLLDAGKIGRGNPITMGFDTTGKAYETDWKGLYSSAIGGRQGSGKSWTAANIIAQSVLHGARLVICDIHAGDDESIANRIAPLSSAYLFDVADSPKSVITAVRNVDAILTARSSGEDKSRGVILLVFDEFTSTLRRLGQAGEEVSHILANIASEGRKFGIFALLIGHNWNAESTGGTEVRDNLTSALIHNLRANEARMLTGLTASSLPSDTFSLAPGQFYLLPKSGDMIKVQSPRMTEQDMVRVGQLLLTDGSKDMLDTSDRAAYTDIMPEVTPVPRQKYATDDIAYPASQSNISVKPMSVEAAEVKRLFLDGMPIMEIAEKLRGVNRNDGKKYQIARADIEQLLRSSV